MDLPRHWRLKDQRYNLQGVVCDDCGARFFPPRQVCSECRGRALSPYCFHGRGEVYSYTTIVQAPENYEEYVPYMVALVRLDEGPMLMAQLTDLDPEEATIGMPVEMVTRKLMEYGSDGFIVYGYKFRPPLTD